MLGTALFSSPSSALPRPAHAMSIADIAFLVIRLPHSRLAPMVSVAKSILAHASIPVRLHVVANQPPEPLRLTLFKMAKYNWHVYSTRTAPDGTAKLLRKLASRGCIGPVCDIYMRKLLLHLYLPRSLRRVVFFDSDVLVRSDIRGLWKMFDDFQPGEAIGVARETNAFYSQEPVESRGGISANGGVVLLDLHELRRDGFYTQLLWRYARRDKSLPLNGDDGVGMAAEQVLYSWMSIEGAPGHRLFKRLPCGWNVQLGSWHAGINLEDANSPRRQCSRCDVLHGAGAEGKEALGILTRELSAGKSCVDAFESVRTRRHYQPKGSPTEALLLRVRDACCAG